MKLLVAWVAGAAALPQFPSLPQTDASSQLSAPIAVPPAAAAPPASPPIVPPPAPAAPPAVPPAPQDPLVSPAPPPPAAAPLVAAPLPGAPDPGVGPAPQAAAGQAAAPPGGPPPSPNGSPSGDGLIDGLLGIDGNGKQGQCPDVWKRVSRDLTEMFLEDDGQCNDDARAAVRATFHDCATWSRDQGNRGGCDGSLILSEEENSRASNRGLQRISNKLRNLAESRGVGVADMIAFAGAHATVSCPLGPRVKTMIGRRDSSRPGRDDLLPANASMTADQILSLMQDKGFSPADTSALVGAHSSSKQFFVNRARAGEPQDRTAGIWDVSFYEDTRDRPDGVFVFQSDRALARDSRSGPAFKAFVGQQVEWNIAFAETFSRMMLLGVEPRRLVDCTSALPKPRDNFPGANPPAAAGRRGGRGEGGEGGGGRGGRGGRGGKGNDSEGDDGGDLDDYLAQGQPGAPAPSAVPNGEIPPPPAAAAQPAAVPPPVPAPAPAGASPPAPAVDPVPAVAQAPAPAVAPIVAPAAVGTAPLAGGIVSKP